MSLGEACRGAADVVVNDDGRRRGDGGVGHAAVEKPVVATTGTHDIPRDKATTFTMMASLLCCLFEAAPYFVYRDLPGWFVGTSYWWSSPASSAMQNHSRHHHGDVGGVIRRRRRELLSFPHLPLCASYRPAVRANRTGRMIPSRVERMPMLPTMSLRGAIIGPLLLLLTNQECPGVMRIVTRCCRIICHFGRYLQRSRMLCRRKEDHSRRRRRQQQARAQRRRRCCMV